MSEQQSAALAAAKAALRKRALAARGAAHARLGVRAGEELAGQAMGLVPRLPGRCVSGFLAIRDEIDTLPLFRGLDGAGYRLCLSVIEVKWQPLVFRAWRPGDALADAPFGLKEPLPSAPLAEPDILLVPLAAFDRRGHRIGYGGGYYDRTLARLRSLRRVTAVGLAFAEQEVPEIPAEVHDERLDHVVTPAGVLSFGSPA